MWGRSVQQTVDGGFIVAVFFVMKSDDDVVLLLKVDNLRKYLTTSKNRNPSSQS